MITPRTTRLVRVPDLQAFRHAVVALASGGEPLDALDRLVVVPTRAAAAQLARSTERAVLGTRAAVLLPEVVTAEDLVSRLAERIDVGRPVLRDAEREALAGVSCKAARDAGHAPPFRLRPGLVAEILRFYDSLRRYQTDIDTFERLALGLLEPGAEIDRGAERLVRQTRFLVAAYREFEARKSQAGVDEHDLRALLALREASRPCRHVLLTVGDRANDAFGLWPADWHLLTRIPGLRQLDVVVTDGVLAGDFHERIHRLLPGIEEVRLEDVEPVGAAPVLMVPPGGMLVHRARDREEEVAGFARRVKAAVRGGRLEGLDRAALVVRQPLPYVYVTREVLRSAGIPCQMFDALPLAAEPFAAAFDLVCSAVGSGFARGPAMALLGSAHFRFGAPSDRLTPDDVVALDRALAESGFLGDLPPLERLVERWGGAQPRTSRMARLVKAGQVMVSLATQLSPLRARASIAAHLDVLLAFMAQHEAAPGPDDPLRTRQLRARGAVLGTLALLRDAYGRFDDAAVDFDDVAALCRRWVEAQTFAPRAGDAGVHLLDSTSARFGDFDEVQLAGLVEGEWPDRPRRNIFYSPSILRELGWPAESLRLDSIRAEFADLLRLPSRRLTVSSFSLESDALVSASSLLDELPRAGLESAEEPPATHRIFEHEALGLDPVDAGGLTGAARQWAELRVAPRDYRAPQFQGTTSGHQAKAFSLSALERYLECPFKFFASSVLKAEEPPDDLSAPSPRARGQFIHEFLQRFFEAWDGSGAGAITADTFDQARALAAGVAEPLLEALPDADAAIERARLFGTAISTGVIDTVLGIEAARDPEPLAGRWLEHRFEGGFLLGGSQGPVFLNGVADRVDLLPGRRLRVIDYKSGNAPDVQRALQAAVYALCAQEQLGEQTSQPWAVDEVAYVAFGAAAKRALVPVVERGAQDAEATLAAARERLSGVIDGIARGEFPPRPHEPMRCKWCAYPSICRKDYVDDE